MTTNNNPVPTWLDPLRSGLGLTLSADEQRAADRSSGLARSLADVQAANQTRDAVMARQQSVLGAPAHKLLGLNGS